MSISGNRSLCLERIQVKCLEAVSAGTPIKALLEEEAEGTIYSVHKKAIYGLISGERLIMLHHEGLGVIPFGIGINLLSDFREHFGSGAGAPLKFSHTRLEFPDISMAVLMDKLPFSEVPRASAIPCSLAIARANLDFAMQYGNKNVETEANSVKLLACAELLFQSNQWNHKDINVICKLAFNPLANLVTAVEHEDNSLIDDSLSRLIGLGEGLTPALDDVLTGLIATLHYLRNHLARGHEVVDALGKSIRAKSRGRTTLISETFLNHAAAGDQFGLIDETIHAVLFLKKNELKSKINKMLSVGDSSGAMILLGLIIGLKLAMDRIGLKDKYG